MIWLEQLKLSIAKISYTFILASGSSNTVWFYLAITVFGAVFVGAGYVFYRYLKWIPEIAEQTLFLYLKMAESSSAQLIVMPETALPVLSSELPLVLKARLQIHAKKNQGDMLVGLVELENGEYFKKHGRGYRKEITYSRERYR